MHPDVSIASTVPSYQRPLLRARYRIRAPGWNAGGASTGGGVGPRSSLQVKSHINTGGVSEAARPRIGAELLELTAGTIATDRATCSADCAAAAVAIPVARADAEV